MNLPPIHNMPQFSKLRWDNVVSDYHNRIARDAQQQREKEAEAEYYRTHVGAPSMLWRQPNGDVYGHPF